MTDQQSFLEILPPVAFGVGEQRTFAITGSYFEIIDAVDPVNIVLSDVYGAQRGLMKGAEASFHLKNTAFAYVQITSATAQTIRFAYGSGEAGTRRAAGAVNIVGTVPVSGPLTDAQLRAAAVPVRPFEQPASNWNSNATMVAMTPLTVFAPGANVNGAILWAAAAADVFTAVNHQIFIAKAGAPANLLDGEIIAQSMVRGVNGANVCFGVELLSPTIIAPGAGLYFISGFAGQAGMVRSARFTLL